MKRSVSAALAALAVVAVTLLALARPGAAAEKATFSYVVPTVIYADLLLGIDKGYFAEEGIDASLLQAGGGAATPALIAGNVQFSGSPAAAISAILKGAKLKVLYITADHAAYQLWARPDIKTLQDLKGKPVGVISRGDTTEIAMRYYLAKHGFPEDYVAYIPLGYGTARTAAITSGSYPASLIDAVEVTELKSAGKLDDLHMLIDLHKDVQMTFSGVATSDALIQSNPDLVLHAMRAVIKGMSYAKAYRDATIASIVHHGVADPKAADVDYDVFAPDISLTGTMPVAAQQFELKLRGEMLGLPKDKVPPPASVFDFSFAEKAAAQLKSEGWKPKP